MVIPHFEKILLEKRSILTFLDIPCKYQKIIIIAKYKQSVISLANDIPNNPYVCNNSNQIIWQALTKSYTTLGMRKLLKE